MTSGPDQSLRGGGTVASVLLRSRSGEGAYDPDSPLVYLVFPSPDTRKGGDVRMRRDGSAFPLRAVPMMILGALCRRAGWRVRIVDENREDLPADDPDLVMIAVWTVLAPSAYELADWYRDRGVPVVLGGVHASLLPGEARRHADAVVTGEAESILHEVLAAAAAGRLRPIYDGVWGGMDQVPGIAEYRDLYDAPMYRRVPVHSLQTSRGCRFNCSYCSVIRINGRGMRHMDVDRAVEELREIRSLRPRIPGGAPIFILDDDLMAEPGYAKSLFEGLVRARVRAPYLIQASTGFGRDEELLDLASRAGVLTVFIGFESLERESLVEANKKNRPGEYAELVNRIHRHGIGVSAGMIFGFDSDGPDVFDYTVDQLERIGVDSARFTALTPLPGTQVFADYFTAGRIVDFDWGHYDGMRAVIEPMNMTRSQLQDGVVRSFHRWYAPRARARRFVRELRDVSWRTAGALAASGRRYANDLDEVLNRRSPPFEANPEDLEQLVITSRAPASEAIGVASRLARGEAGPRPVAPTAVRLVDRRQRTPHTER